MGGDDPGATLHVKWWATNAEFCFTEEIILVVLIMVAVLFELSHHKIQHKILSRGKHYFTSPLWHRMNSEFMVLGFLAFVVWIVSRAGGFKAAVAHVDESALGPTAYSDLLHLVEDVHMRLFMSMCLYFIMMGITVMWCERKMKGWCFHYETGQLRASMESQGETDLSSLLPNPYISGREEQQFAVIETKFKKWLDSQDFTHVRFGHRHVSEAVVRKYLRNFNLAAYLTSSMEEILLEMVHIKVQVWIGVLVVYGIMAATSALVPASDEGELWKILAVVILVSCVLILMLIWVVRAYKTLVHPDKWSTNVCGKWRIEIIMVRCMQIGLFFSCYSLLWFVSAEPPRDLYEVYHDLIPLYVTLYIIPFLVFCLILIPYLMPRFNMIMRLPPYVDREDLKQVLKVSLGHYHTIYLPRLHPVEADSSDDEHEKWEMLLHVNSGGKHYGTNGGGSADHEFDEIASAHQRHAEHEKRQMALESHYAEQLEAEKERERREEEERERKKEGKEGSPRGHSPPPHPIAAPTAHGSSNPHLTKLEVSMFGETHGHFDTLPNPHHKHGHNDVSNQHAVRTSTPGDHAFAEHTVNPFFGNDHAAAEAAGANAVPLQPVPQQDSAALPQQGGGRSRSSSSSSDSSKVSVVSNTV